jgi:SpoIID/LytB domain protein
VKALAAVLAAALAAGAAIPARAADAARTAADSTGAFLQGRYDDAASGWRYLETLGAEGWEPEANEALSARDAGEPEKAVPLWIRATLVPGVDGFYWNQRAWAELAVGRRRDARRDFLKAIDRSSTTSTQTEADLGLGLAAILDDKPRGAMDPLRRAALSGPYGIAMSAQLTAEAAFKLRDKQTALTYLRQAVATDPYDRDALRELTDLLDRIGDNRGAWLAARQELSLDPDDDDARRIMKRNSRFIIGDPDSASGARRIALPELDPTDTDAPLPEKSPDIRVGLYGAPDGRPATITRCYLMSNSKFKVTSPAYGTLRGDGVPGTQWSVEYRRESGVVEVRNASGNILFVSKQPFSVVPDGPRGTVLLKSAKIADSVGVDVGDREVRGSVEVIPNPWGFRLVEKVPLELYLYGVVSVALPEGSAPAAYDAQAVVARTAAAWAMGHHASTLEDFSLLDDLSVQKTIGVSGELRDGAAAVRRTEGMILAKDGLVAYAPQHDDSGGRTEDGAAAGVPDAADLVSVPDSASNTPLWSTPLGLERFVHEPPPDGLYSDAAPAPTASAARWMRLIDASDLRDRVDKRRRLGPLLNVVVTGRTDTGRVKSLKVVGTRGELEFKGFPAIQELLSPGSLRSALFTLQPLYRGRKLSRLMVWGAGTGSGLGFSRAGAMGQAALGIRWRRILAHYFPKYEIQDLYHPPKAARAARKGRRHIGPYRRTKNFRAGWHRPAPSQKK